MKRRTVLCFSPLQISVHLGGARRVRERMDLWCSRLSDLSPLQQYFLLRDTLILLLIVSSVWILGARPKQQSISVTLHDRPLAPACEAGSAEEDSPSLQD